MRGMFCPLASVHLSDPSDEFIDRQDVEDKKTIISLFLARFTLTEAEVEALTSRDVPIGQRFFEAMDRTEKIREDCRVLMSGEDGPTKAGCVSSFRSLMVVMLSPSLTFYLSMFPPGLILWHPRLPI